MTDMSSLNERLQSHHWCGKSWMWDTRDAIGHMTIAQVAMTGTHNTATYQITRKSKFGRDGPRSLRSNGALASVVRFFGGFLMPSWSTCQRLTVAQQLDFGVRYFDLRVAPYSALSTTLYTTHGLLSTKLADVLRAVEAFVTDPATSNEFVLLDFQHVFLSPSDPGYTVLFQSLVRIEDLCVPRPQNGNGFPTLAELWKGQQRVFIFMGCNFDVDGLSFVCSREAFLSSPWLNRHTRKDLLCALDAHAAEMPLRRDTTRVFLTQAVITPNRNTVLSGVFSLGVKPSSVRALAKHANADLIKWFWARNAASTSSRGMHTNILLLDYPELRGAEVTWDGGSLRGSVVDVCVCINLLRGLSSSCGVEHRLREHRPSPGMVEEWSSADPCPCREYK